MMAVDAHAQGLGLHDVQYNAQARTSPSSPMQDRQQTTAKVAHDDSAAPPAVPLSTVTPSDADMPAAAQPRTNKPLTLRSKSAFALNKSQQNNLADDPPESPMPTVRHGWQIQPLPTASSERTAALAPATLRPSGSFPFWIEKRHESSGHPFPVADLGFGDWRMRDRLKTVGAVLVPCLNPTISPPGVTRTENCAKLICWIDSSQDIPSQPSASGTNEPQTNPLTSQIGKALQSQFEALSMRTRYKVLVDPTADALRKQCMLMRKSCKDERVLLYYNGYGVPEPTLNAGEIWVFNSQMTQYIPLPLESLQDWLRAPGIYLYDCNHAGRIIKQFLALYEKRAQRERDLVASNPDHVVTDFSENFHLAACRDTETLPTNPSLPADLFTSCLTTPIDMAVRFFVLQNKLYCGLTVDDVRDIPGKISERRTPLGELNWIFTAITDTIAWNTLYNVDRALFKKLFRQDLMVAALMRNFLLAQRVMRVYGCTPVSHPPIPAKAYNHPLWDSWDYAIEMVLQQLPSLKLQRQNQVELDYQHSEFFTQQLSAFEIYLGHGALRQERPEQLPIVLQVLLSQVHRLRALVLLSKFLDLGPWAVHMALSIGIFPYVLKLLQSQAQELKPVMIFIWARLLAIDQTCQTDLMKDNGYQYFINLLNPSFTMPITNLAEHRAMCAFIIATFCENFQPAQNVCLSTNPETIAHLAEHTEDHDNARLRQHACLCISMLWKDFREAKWQGIRSGAQLQLCRLVTDDVPEVRTAMLTALTNFIGIPDLTEQVANIEADVATNLLPLSNDGSVIVRKEYVIFMSVFVNRYRSRFVVAAWEEMLEERKKQVQKQQQPQPDAADSPPERRGPTSSSPEAGSRASTSSGSMPRHNIFASMWRQVLTLSVDPHPEVSRDASVILDNVLEELFSSNLGQSATRIVGDVIRNDKDTPKAVQQTALDSVKQQTSHVAKVPPSPGLSPTPKSTESYLSAGLRRTASVAAQIVGMGRSGKDSQSPTLGSVSSFGSQSVRTPGARSRGAVPSDWTLPPTAADKTTMQAKNVEASQPGVPDFVPRDPTKPPTLPLQSSFFEWSAMYFREPQMRPSEADEQGSLNFVERTWRRNRNDELIASTVPTNNSPVLDRWSTSGTPIDNGALSLNLMFHQFEDHLLTSDGSIVSVWDWKKNARLTRFSNGNPEGSRITNLRFINEDDVALVMTGSSDGIVKLYRKYDDNKTIELASTFRALSDLVPSTHNAGLILNWQQAQGHLLVAGDERVVRIWDAASEKCVADVPARSGSNVTSLSSDQVGGNIFVAGFGDGAVRIFDLRAHPAQSMVHAWREHRGWIIGTRLQRGASRELVTAERGGSVKLWDIRNEKSIGTVRTRSDGAHVGVARTLSVHDYAPVLAIGTSHNSVRLYNTNDVIGSCADTIPLSTIELPTSQGSGMLQSHSKRGGSPVASTAFHPHRLLLAASTIHQGDIRLYKCKSPQAKSGKGVADAGDLDDGKSVRSQRV